jgi:hypothetical protein
LRRMVLIGGVPFVLAILLQILFLG